MRNGEWFPLDARIGGFMKKRLTAFAVFIIYLVICAAPLQTRAAQGEDTGNSALQAWPLGPEISGDGAIVLEASTGCILYEKNVYDRFYPASTTKILTTLVALENSDMNEIVTVSYAADNYVSKTSSRMGLVEGEQITMEQALYGIMLESANEATYAVGEHVGGSIARFIKMMNSKAQALGCTRSHFANSHGLHDEDHYTCAYDLSLIARAAYNNPTFMEITGTATYAMPETNKNEAKLLTNHHWFLNKTMRYDYCIGGKTGSTTQAGMALVTYAKKDGMMLISVVMHAPTWQDVYNDSKNLLEYAFDNFTSYKMKDLRATATAFPAFFGNIARFNEGREELITLDDEGVVVLPKNIDVSNTSVSVNINNDAEVDEGANVIGSITYSYGDRIVGSSDIIYNDLSEDMTDAKFKRLWPSFMIPPEVVFTPEELSSFEAAQEPEPTAPEISDVFDFSKLIPVGIGVGVALAALGLGFAVYALIRRH